jgi:hypothetical protein
MNIDNFLILDKNNKVRYQRKDIKNTFHQQGEEYILNALFKGSENLVSNGYYIGLDARPTLNRTDTLSNIIGEPLVQGNNYQRQNVSFLNWQITNPNNSTTTASPTGTLVPYYAKSGPVIFSALNSGWNSVTNIFLTTTIGAGGKLISSATLGTTVSVAIGESVVMEMSISLYDY